MDFLGLGKKMFLRRAKSAITKAFEEDRIVFFDDKVEYTDKEGNKTVLGINGMSAHLLTTMSDFLVAKTGNEMATPVLLDVGIKDIREILEQLRGKR